MQACFDDGVGNEFCKAVVLRKPDGAVMPYWTAQIDLSITEARTYYLLLAPCPRGGNPNGFHTYSYSGEINFENHGSMLGIGDIPLKYTMIVESFLWLLIFGGHVIYHWNLRSKLHTFNTLVYVLAAWPLLQFMSTLAGAVKIWYLDSHGITTSTVEVFTGTLNGLMYLGTCAVLFLVASGYSVVSKQPWKLHSTILGVLMLAVLVAAVCATLGIGRYTEKLWVLGLLAVLVAISAIIIGIMLFLLARRTQTTVQNCNLVEERRSDIVMRYKRLSIVAAVVLGFVALWILMGGILDFATTVNLPGWVNDTFFEAAIMSFCVVVLILFRLSAGEDLNLIHLLPVNSDETLNLPGGVLPKGPGAYLDEEDDDFSGAL